jgi:hypothetical protein
VGSVTKRVEKIVWNAIIIKFDYIADFW